MPSLWSGSITFGLVSIPVRLETSHRGSDLSFNLLHKECRQRINLKYYCPTCDQYLERSDLIKGYEYEKGRYVVLEEEDFEIAEGEASRNIDVVAFTDYAQLKPVYLNKTYYLVPERGAEKGYLLLLKGMEETQKVAVTRFVMRGKEYIGAVSFSPEGMLLHILFHKGEFKDIDEVVHLPEVELKEKEMSLARQIIENLTEDFSEEMLTDQYRERLLDIIRQKVEGEQVTIAAEARPPKVVDLMEALKRSLDMTAQKKPAARVSAAGRQEEKKKRKRA
jgi:DNA end-binding protein Ku